MPDIAASNVSYVPDLNRKVMDKMRSIPVQISFGDGVLTYPAGGIPLSLSKLGLVGELIGLEITEPDADDGLVYKWDKSANTLRLYYGDYSAAVDGPLVEVPSGSYAPAATVIEAIAKGW
jgi:hypothetical protein